ncbi:YkvA family protein [Pseudonocardia hispaniensis]|uniref:YkvA family protein n=1 Tax=Pseudonocardia hispaniensis TaxID=904933 RepID=A0ABW1J292_9PSEU
MTPRRVAAFHALRRVVTHVGRPGDPGLGARVRVLPRMVGGAFTGRYPGLTHGRLALFALAVAYLVSPLDVVPEAALMVLGLVDDSVVALWLAGAFLAETQRYLEWDRQRCAVPAAA